MFVLLCFNVKKLFDFLLPFLCVIFWHLRANLILCIDVALHYLKPVVKSVVLMRSANFYNPVNNHFTLQS